MTLSYTVVLSVVMIGTALGFVIGDYYQQEAFYEEEDAIEELHQIYQMQNAVFRVRSQQYKLTLYPGFLTRMGKIGKKGQ